MIRRLLILTILFMLIALAVSAQQSLPPEIEVALADLNTRTGLALTLDDIDEWGWREEAFSDASLGCPLPDTLYAQVISNAYVITFRIDSEVYDYRAPRGSNQAIFCSVTTLAEATETPSVGGTWEYIAIGGEFNPHLDWSPTGAAIAVSGVAADASGNATGMILLYNADDLNAAPEQLPLAQPVTAIEYVASDPVTYLVTGGSAGDVAIFPVEPTGFDILFMQLPADQAFGTVNDVAINADRTMIASVNAAENDAAIQQLWVIRVWDANSGALLTTLQPQSPITALDFSPDGSMLAAGGMDGSVMLFAIETGSIISVLGASMTGDAAPAHVTEVEYSPDGLVLAVASGSSINLWDVSTAPDSIAVTQTITVDSPVQTIDFSPDGGLIAAAGGDPSQPAAETSAIRIWDRTTGAVVATLSGHTDAVGDIAFSPDGLRLASVSYDGTLRVWSLGVTVG